MSAPAGSPPESPAEPSLPAKDRSELGMCLLLLVLGVYLVLGARGISVPGSSNTVGPRAFPTLVGALVAVVAVALAVRVWRGDRADPDSGEDVDAQAPVTWRPVGLVALAFAVHALLINVVGWPLAARPATHRRPRTRCS